MAKYLINFTSERAA